MDTVMQFDAYGGSAALQEKVKRRVEELEGEFSTTQENSDIFHLNQEKTAELSSDTRYLMQEALVLGRNRWCARYFDLPGCTKLGIYNGKLPITGESRRESLLKSVDYRLVGLEADTASIEPGMMVDLGGVGKGFTGDEVVKTMKGDGVTSALFSLGGNIRRSEQNRMARNGISASRIRRATTIWAESGCRIGRSLPPAAMRRYFTDDDGTIYWHIMDPSTGAPAHSRLISVTIIRLRADCAAMGFRPHCLSWDGKGSGTRWAAHQDYEAVLVEEQRAARSG